MDLHAVTCSDLQPCWVVLHAVSRTGLLPGGEIRPACSSSLTRELHVATTQCDPYAFFAVSRTGNFHVQAEVLDNANLFCRSKCGIKWQRRQTFGIQNTLWFRKIIDIMALVGPACSSLAL